MCSDSTVALQVQHLSKQYRLYQRPLDRVKQWLRPSKRYYQPFDALKDVTFTVQRGETLAIIGRNGSGKSTLLQLLCGTTQPTSGHIHSHGRLAALLELGAGFNPEFTGRENIYLNGAILGLSRAQMAERIDDIIAFADIGPHIDQPVKSYSSGMYVRLGFAVMVHVDADILIIDEALAVGDARFVQKCMRFLRDFQQRGTVIFVSHDSSAVTALCDRAVWLHQGQVQQIGPAKTVCESYLAMLFDQENTEATAVSTQTDWADWHDQRHDLINQSTLRNDLQVFAFNEGAAGFGEGGARIVDVQLQNSQQQPLQWVVGGELVRLVIHIKALRDLDRPIVGFYVKNYLGQELFGDNSYMTYQQQPVAVAAGQQLEAVFEFPMPRLPAGDYAISVAVANGTQMVHSQEHWLHEALLFNSQASSTVSGLVGVPMKTIALQTK